LPVLAWTIAGSLLWVVALTLAGRLLGAGYGQVVLWLGPVARGVKGVLLLGALGVVLLTLLRRRRA
jgi:membrane protein DedA with SNARE-associated domain